MEITRISVSSARKSPHPTLEFASLSSLVTVEAELQPGDKPFDCISKLQAEADRAVETHLHKLEERSNGRLYWGDQSRKATANTAESLAEKHGGKF
jgi:hypothetical protein